MSLGLLEQIGGLPYGVEEVALARAARRERAIKWVCFAVLAVCFWFSVPYQFPLEIDPNPAVAAANEAVAYQGSLSRQIALPVIALVSMFLLWRLPRRGSLHGSLRGFLAVVAVGYCGWVMTSLLWSTQPDVTGKRLVVFAIDVLFAVTLARCFDIEEIASFGFATTAAVALVALYVELPMRHRFAPFDPDYRFMGVMTANYMAMNIVVSMICALTLAARHLRRLRWVVPVVLVELALLYLTRSRLSTIVGLLMLTVLLVRMIRERVRAESRALLLMGLLAIVVPALVYAAGSRGWGAAQSAFMLGRTDSENTASLSNRAPLWSELLESAEARPVLGFGYAGFWTPQRVERVSMDQGWAVPNAHDTYLDQWLSVGLVGALLYIALVWSAGVMAWRGYLRERSLDWLFCALMITWLSLTSLAESTPLDPYLPTMLAYVCVAKMVFGVPARLWRPTHVDGEAVAMNGAPLFVAGSRTASAPAMRVSE